MDTAEASAAELTIERRNRARLIVILLGLSQIVGYGTLFYSFSIIAADAAKGLGWPASWLFAAFSVGLFGGGLIAPLIGRMVDRRGAPLVMSLGSLAAAIALAVAAVAPHPLVFVIAMLGMQLSSPLVQYDAAFAALVQSTGAEARARITHLTLIAGFSSTLFWPFTTWLQTFLDWREILGVFAAGNLLICLPIHLWLMRERRRPVAAQVGEPSTAVAMHVLPAAQQARALWLATLAFALSGFALSAMLTQMVPMLTALGLGGGALLVSTLFGPAQVLMRFTNLLLAAGRHPIQATLLALVLLPLAIALLTLSAPALWGAVLFALLLGFGSGLKSIVQGTLPLALFGPAGYGGRLGLMSSVRQALASIAPFTLAFANETIGPHAALWGVTLVGLAGLMCGLGVLLEVRRT